LPNPEHQTISNLESEIPEGGDHEILENLERNKDKPVITKTREYRTRNDIPVTSPNNRERIIPVTVYKRNNITPSYQPNFRLSPRQVDWLTSEVKRLEREDKIVKTNSPFNSPLNLVAKDNAWRFTISGDISFRDSRFRTIHLESSPSRIENFPKRIPEPNGVHLITLSPFDIHPYMDDLIYGADDIKELDQKTSKLLRLLEHHKMKINKDKCVFNALSIEALGFEISQGSIRPKVSYLTKLSETPTPTNVQRLRKFIGKFNHVREHLTRHCSNRTKMV
jgi:hypothetical protein